MNKMLILSLSILAISLFTFVFIQKSKYREGEETLRYILSITESDQDNVNQKAKHLTWYASPVPLSLDEVEWFSGVKEIASHTGMQQPDGSVSAPTMIMKHQFNTLGFLTALFYEKTDGKLLSPKRKYSYTYDSLGRVESIQEGGTLIEFSYGKKNAIVERTQRFPPKAPNTRYTYTYTSEGVLDKRFWYSSKGKLLNIVEYTHDSMGRITEELTTDTMGVRQTRRVNNYNEQNSMSDYVVSRFRDIEGEKVERFTTKKLYTYSSYDSLGNWQERAFHVITPKYRSEFGVVKSREITYYDTKH